jgi:acetylornithine aminotransferase
MRNQGRAMSLAESFFNDPRLREAKRLALDALAEHQRRLPGPRPADAAQKATYEQTLAEFNKLRGGALYFPYLGSGFGRGPLVELADGSVKYDMISGIGVHHLGHGHPALIEAGIDAAVRDTVMQGNLQQGVESVTLARELVELAQPSKLKHCFLSTSGAMANDNALKMALHARHPATRVLAFDRAFAGRTLALSQITDSPKYREGLPTAINVDYVPFYDARRPREGTQATLAALHTHLRRYPGQHAVMVMELIQGEGGYYPGDRDFFLRLIEQLTANRIAVFADEVQTFGRTSEPFAFQHFGLAEHVDLVSIGKLSQVCATLFTDDLQPKPGLISQTFTGSTSSILAARTILRTLRDTNCFGPTGRNAQVFARFAANFDAIAKRNPKLLTGPFGLGGMIAFTPLDGSADAAKKAAMALFEEGLISFVAGHDPARIRFLPPVPVVTDADIDAACAIVERVLTKLERMMEAGES